MRVDGKNHTIYECDNSSKRNASEGTVYNITNNQGLEAMLLNRSLCTKEKELQVINALNGIGEWYGPQLRDILYTHGKFRGYVYYKMEEPESETIIDETPIGSSGTQDSHERTASVPKSYNILIRVIYLIAAIFIVVLIGMKILYPSMLQSSYYAGSDAGSLFAAISFNGKLGVVIGAVTACACTYFMISKNAVLYYASVPVISVIASALVYFLIKMIIWLVGLAVNLFVALIPTIMFIGFIVFLVKCIIK